MGRLLSQPERVRHHGLGAISAGLRSAGLRTKSSNMTADFAWDELLGATLEHAATYRRSLASRPVGAVATTEVVLEALAPLGAMPSEGRSPRQVLDELVEYAEPGLTSMAGPRFFGWVTGGTLPAALAADWMTSTWDQNAGPATGAPAAAAFELLALRWLCELLGLPEQTRGALVSGATLANFSALAAARHQVLGAAGWDVEHDGLFGAPAVRILVGRERHDTIDKAVRLLGFGKRALVVVDADGQGRLVPSALRRELDKSTGPMIVCAQAGNVNSGAFDPMPAIGDAIDEYRARLAPELVWWHVDGAFGMWARAAALTSALAEGVERADSWATDGHKFLNLPYDSGIVLTRHPRAQRRAMAVHGAYLSSGSASAIQNPGSLAPELSRRARGFVLWSALRQLGRRGVEDLVTRCVELAGQLARGLDALAGLSVLNDVVYNQVVARAEPPPGGAADLFTRELCVALQREGTCYPTPTIWRGAPALRFSVSNADSRPEDIVATVAAVGRVYASLCS
jgi:glutamate/tyrosine decarboxylase-like PLP-dependent enzyme